MVPPRFCSLLTFCMYGAATILQSVDILYVWCRHDSAFCWHSVCMVPPRFCSLLTFCMYGAATILQSVDILYVWCRHDSAVFVAFFSSTFNTFNITTAAMFKLTRSVSLSVGHTGIIVDMWWTLFCYLELDDWKLKIIMWFWNEFQDDKFLIFVIFKR